MPGEEGRSQGRASRLYCSLSLLEISFYTATWISGVLYSLYTLYLASMDKVKTKRSQQSGSDLLAMEYQHVFLAFNPRTLLVMMIWF